MGKELKVCPSWTWTMPQSTRELNCENLATSRMCPQQRQGLFSRHCWEYLQNCIVLGLSFPSHGETVFSECQPAWWKEIQSSHVGHSNHLVLFGRQPELRGHSFKVTELVIGKGCGCSRSPILPSPWPWPYTRSRCNRNAGVRTRPRLARGEDANDIYEMFSCVPYCLCHAEKSNTGILYVPTLFNRRGMGRFFCFVFPNDIFKLTGRKANFLFFSITYKSVSIIWSQAYFFP